MFRTDREPFRRVRTTLGLLPFVASTVLLVSCSSDAAKREPDPAAAPIVAAAKVRRADLTRALAVTAEFRGQVQKEDLLVSRPVYELPGIQHSSEDHCKLTCSA